CSSDLCGWKALPAMGVTLLAALTAGSHLAVRPEIFSFAFAGIWLETLMCVSEKTKGNSRIDWRSIGLLTVLMCLWSNLHTLFLVGMMLPGFYSGCMVLEKFVPSLKGKPFNWTVPIMTIACIGASLINPWGFGLWGYIPNVFGPFNDTNNEMQPIRPGSMGNPFFWPFFLFIVTGFNVLIKNWRKPLDQGDLFFRSLVPLGAAAGFKTIRSIPFAGLLLTAGTAKAGETAADSNQQPNDTLATQLNHAVRELTIASPLRWAITCMA